MDRVLVERAIAGDRGAFNELARMSIGRLSAGTKTPEHLEEAFPCPGFARFHSA
jgi:hypothetical protein